MLLLRHYLRKRQRDASAALPGADAGCRAVAHRVSVARQRSRVEEPRRATGRSGMGSADRSRGSADRDSWLARDCHRRAELAASGCSIRTRSQRHVALSAAQAPPIVCGSGLIAGENFWTVVHQPFKAHELTRDDLAALIHRGLEHTRGSYRALLGVFGLPPTDYKRFHAFLYQQNCNLPVGPYRTARATMRRQDRPPSVYTPAC